MVSKELGQSYSSAVVGFVTERLTAEPVTLADAPVFERLWGDERVARTLGGVRNADAVHRSLADSVEHWAIHGFGRWLVRCEEPVGNVKLEHCDVTGEPEVELGYALFPECWGLGYATEAARGALSVAEDLGLGSVIAFALLDNQSSFAVMRRLGFVEERVIQLPVGPHSVWRVVLQDRR